MEIILSLVHDFQSQSQSRFTDSEWWYMGFGQENQDNIFHVCSRILDIRKPYLPNVILNTWPMSRQSNWFRLKSAADIFLRITLHDAPSWSCAVRYRAIISIRGITDVSSFHTVSTSRKLPRSTLAAGWQLAPKKHRKTSRPVITVAPVLSSHYQRALARCINLIRFSGWSVWTRGCVAQIFTHDSHFPILKDLLYIYIYANLYWKFFIPNFRNI